MSEVIINNSLYFCQKKKTFWRAIYQDVDNNLLAICQINQSTIENSNLQIVALDTYRNLILAGSHVLQEDDPFSSLLFSFELSEKQKNKIDERFALLMPFLEEGINIFKKPRRIEVISQVSEKSKLSKKSIKRYLNLYFACGCMPSALAPQYSNCGAPNTPRISKNKLGRPSQARVGMPLDKAQIRLIHKGYKEFYSINGLVSLYDAYTSTINKYFVPGQEEGLDKLNIQVPSEFQFMYHGKQGSNSTKIEKQRLGNIIYDKDHQLLKGSANKRVYGPGSCYQIDSTQKDINLVSSLDPNISVGRPTFYLVTDVYSRMVVGFTITLENASYMSAALALHAAAEDKLKFCKKNGLNIKATDWPSSGLPKSLLADKGDLKGKLGAELIEKLAKNLGQIVNLKIAVSYRPDHKGNVETLFKTLQARIKRKFYKKGTITKSDRTRTGSDSRKEAVLTLAELNAIFLQVVMEYNKYHYLKKYPLTEDMIRNKVKAVPCDLWQYGCRKGKNSTRQVDSLKLYFNILPNKSVRIDKEGVKFEGIDYSTKDSALAKTLNLLLDSKKKKVRIAYDPRNIQKIFLIHDKNFHALEPRISLIMDRDFWDYKEVAKQLRKDEMEQRKIESLYRKESDDFMDSFLQKPNGKQKGKVSTKDMTVNRKREKLLESQNVHPPGDIMQEKAVPKSRLRRKSFRDIIDQIQK